MPGAMLLVVFCDSSLEGAGGISIRERPNEVWQTAGMSYDGATSIATFGVPLKAQDHRESAGRLLAMRLLQSLVNIRGWSLPGGSSSSTTASLWSWQCRRGPILGSCRQTRSTWPGP
jgi:hypothetical protein